jgi:hypothetical protein
MITRCICLSVPSSNVINQVISAFKAIGANVALVRASFRMDYQMPFVMTQEIESFLTMWTSKWFVFSVRRMRHRISKHASISLGNYDFLGASI